MPGVFRQAYFAIALFLSTFAVPANASDVNIFKELLINDTRVVDSPRAQPNGPWSFGMLMRNLVNGEMPGPEGVVKKWLANWLTDSPAINGHIIPNRNQAFMDSVITPWMKKDGATEFGAWEPNLENAPFRLLAIVNRIDLRHIAGGHIIDAGEGRFVFGAVNWNNVQDDAGGALPFTVIFEYNLNASSETELIQWANDWHALGNVPMGEQFNAALNVVTDKFSKADKPFGSPSLNQIRTNEILSNPWELREFNYMHADFALPAELKPVTVKQTPNNFESTSSAENWNNTEVLATFLKLRKTAIDNGTYYVPENFAGNNFLGAAAHAPFDWAAPGFGPTDVTLRRFAINTCNGCHTGETKAAFLHVGNRRVGDKAALSPFLLGTNAPDKTDPDNQTPGNPNAFINTSGSGSTPETSGMNELWQRKILLESFLVSGASLVGKAGGVDQKLVDQTKVVESLFDARAARVH